MDSTSSSLLCSSKSCVALESTGRYFLFYFDEEEVNYSCLTRKIAEKVKKYLIYQTDPPYGFRIPVSFGAKNSAMDYVICGRALVRR